MKLYNFSSDLILKYQILEDTQIVVPETVDLTAVEDVITDLLPEPSKVKDSKVSLRVLEISQTHTIAYWDLIFEFPKGYDPYILMDYIQNQATQLDDSFDHYHSPYLPPSLREKDQTIFKISFKVG